MPSFGPPPPNSMHRATAICSREALLSNFKMLASEARGQQLIPMIKADAYGHGAEWAARTLVSDPGVRIKLSGLGVATLDEAISLRSVLGSKGARTRILAFSGAAPWSDAVGEACLRFGITPVIASIEDWRKFSRSRWMGRLPYELKFNTGMNRLGINLSELATVRRGLRNALPGASAHPTGVLSHLAQGELPRSPLSRLQISQFRELVSELAVLGDSGTRFHLANSSGIWGFKQWGLAGLTSIVRPGLSLYGVPPFPGAEARGLRPVMDFGGIVSLTREVDRGERVGYGGRFVAKGRRTIAILGMGYADGVSRSWGIPGSGAKVLLKGRTCRFAGAVSMDLTGVVATSKVRAGERARLFGEGIDPWKQAEAAGTTPYEILTSVGARVKRIYV